MVIVLDANGNVMQCAPSQIHQGSNKANSIVVLSPLTAGLACTIAYKLPTGVQSFPVLMTPTTSTNKDLNAWITEIDRSLTDYYGTVDLQVSFYTTGEPTYDTDDNITGYTGDLLCTALCTFEVLKGVTPINPAVPSDNIYEQILGYLSTIGTNMASGDVASKCIVNYNISFTYPKDAVVQSDGVFYKSLVADNTGHEVTDTDYWQKILIPITSKTTLGGTYTWYEDGALHIYTEEPLSLEIEYSTLPNNSLQATISTPYNFNVSEAPNGGLQYDFGGQE